MSNILLIVLIIFSNACMFFFIEGIIKPIIAYQGKKTAVKYLPTIIDKLDPVMPELIANLTEDELRAYLGDVIYNVSGNADEKHINQVIILFCEMYSPLANAKKLNDLFK